MKYACRFHLTLHLLGFGLLSAQDAGRSLQPIDDVLKDVDKLIQGFDRGAVVPQASPIVPVAPVAPALPLSVPSVVSPAPATVPLRIAPQQPLDPDASSFRYKDALKPANLISDPVESAPVQSSGESRSALGAIDYSNATLAELLELVDPMSEPGKVQLLREPETKQPEPELKLPEDNLEKPSADPDLGNRIVRTTNLFEEQQENLQPEEPYLVLGEKIDEELKEKIREAIDETRRASGGTGNPYVTRTVYKATAFCNRILGRLNLPHHKRYRRDVLLSLIRMHERNGAWVDAAKSYERYLEEFANDEKYPFEDHLDAPGIPEMRSDPGDREAWNLSRKRGAPTIPETHFRTGKIYRKLGAHQMAHNKFYDAMNASLVLAEDRASQTIAPSRDFAAREARHEAVAKQAMIEIAETYLDAEDYDGAIKFYGRLLRIEDMEINDRGEVLFKHALSHYRRARENLKKEERRKRDSEKSIIRPDLKTEKLPKADFTNVKLDLRDYSKNFPSSQYVPEAHYVLALTYDQLNERKMAIVELLKLLKGSPFRPEVMNAEIQSKPEHERDYKQIARMRGLWIFWKKKTGNYLANKFFEEGDFHSALRVYEAMREIDQTADWRVPVLYQIALCQEKLGLYVQAVETYSEVRDEVQMGSADTAARVEGNKYLKYVYGMAKWRREQLEETRSIRQAANRYGIRTGASLSNPDGS